MCALQIVLALSLRIIQLPPVTEGRRPVLNQHGYAETAENFNATQWKFVERAVERAQLKPKRPSSRVRQPVVFEVGGAFGDLGLEILRRGAFYFYNDMDADHEAIADALFQDAQLLDSQYNTFLGRFPFEDFTTAFICSNLECFEITDIGIFSVAMYLSGPELVQFFQWAYAMLPSGGRLYLTAISPHCNLFPGYEPLYFEKHARFLATGGREEPFPGWIEDVRKPPVGAFLPPGYLKQYPPSFHLLHPDVLWHYASRAGFLNVESGFLKRPKPERLRYTGDDPTVGELSSLIVEKP